MYFSVIHFIIAHNHILFCNRGVIKESFIFLFSQDILFFLPQRISNLIIWLLNYVSEMSWRWWLLWVINNLLGFLRRYSLCVQYLDFLFLNSAVFLVLSLSLHVNFFLFACCVLDSCGGGGVEGFCEHGDELSDSIKCKISLAAAEPVAPKHWFYFM